MSHIPRLETIKVASCCYLLNQRAQYLAQIRQFFNIRNVLEVDTAHLATSTTPDPKVASIKVNNHYLQPSPEFFMKRLLAQGSGDIYQLAHVFRDDEPSFIHQKEFSLLEWYRVGFTLEQLMDEVLELISIFLPQYTPVSLSHCGLDPQSPNTSVNKTKISYQQLFKKYLNIDNVHRASVTELEDLYLQFRPPLIAKTMTKDDWLDLIMADILQPQLQGVVLLHSYPKSQASLAKIKDNVAQRFELFVDGIELANGFDELHDVNEQRQRFNAELAQRHADNLELIPIDEQFLQALALGLPQCCGVALGVDRLFMLAMNVKSIADTKVF